MQLRKEYCEILPVKSATWDTVRSPEDAAGADDACCCASAISAAFLHSSSARLTSPDTAATCRDSLPQYTAYCQDGKGFSAHDTKTVHCRSSATSTAFLHSSSARLTSPDTAASCTDALLGTRLLPGWFWPLMTPTTPLYRNAHPVRMPGGLVSSLMTPTLYAALP